ncbi:MAG: 16S rRNA (cytidine(1402)-2'-O)-methyltransferase [Gammaproteobacteria bacterium]|nr:16S rRNA (cytidine(1402)-2'-O)-methyltransferase [Gammaproteobacteria bacterium]
MTAPEEDALPSSSSAAVQPGTLFVVATPIGNLDDASPRARSTLQAVALIAAEDTRHTRTLLASWGIDTDMISLHEHNEEARIPGLLERLRSGEDLALVSDAGTPLLADPGYRLVRAVVAAGLPVRPIPGPCALVAALSASGLPTDRFLFAGFLPAKSGPRQAALAQLRSMASTLVFYETPHRIAAALADAAQVLGGEREAWVGRELTKRFETHYAGSLADLAQRFAAGEEEERGEFVLIIGGADASTPATEIDADAVLEALLAELPASKAAKVAAKLLDRPRQALFQRCLELTQRG